MKIEILVDPSRPAPAASLASRVAPPPTSAPATGVVATQGARSVLTSYGGPATCSILYSLRNGRVGARRGARGGRGGGRKEKVTPKSAADLDAEMEVRGFSIRVQGCETYRRPYSGLHRQQCARCSGCLISGLQFPFSSSMLPVLVVIFDPSRLVSRCLGFLALLNSYLYALLHKWTVIFRR
jgi:hypothetical protein